MKKIAGLFLLAIIAVVAIPIVKYKTLSPCEMLKTEIVERSRAKARAATDRGREEVSELGEDAVRIVEGIGSAVENAVAGVSTAVTEARIDDMSLRGCVGELVELQFKGDGD